MNTKDTPTVEGLSEAQLAGLQNDGREHCDMLGHERPGEGAEAFVAGYRRAFKHIQSHAAAGLISDEQIDATWEALDGKKIIAGENQLNWNRALRRAFARALPSAHQGQAARLLSEEERSAVWENLPQDYDWPAKWQEAIQRKVLEVNGLLVIEKE